MSIRIRSRAAAVVGGTVRLAIYPEDEVLIRDAAHARLIEWILSQVATGWRATLEAPVPGPGRRASDIRLDGGADVVLFEVETRIQALESNVRELASKREAVAQREPSARVHAVLALADSRHHRTLIAHHPRIIASALPVSSERIKRALASSAVPWPGDGLLWLPMRLERRGMPR